MDPTGESVKMWKFNWRDRRVMGFINNFTKLIRQSTLGNVDRQKIYKTGALRRSLYWDTFATHGGDEQVFRANYIYYAKFVELALGRGMPFNGLPPTIPGKQWQPIKMPDRPRRAKPAIATEMRRQASRFLAITANELQYAGTVYMIFAAGNSYSAQAAINRALFFDSTRGAFRR